MEKELIIRNKVFLQQYNNTLKQFDAESWFIPKGNSTKDWWKHALHIISINKSSTVLFFFIIDNI